MLLEQLEFDVSLLSDAEKILPRLKKERFDVILLDMNFQRGQTEGTEGLFWLEKVKKEDPELVVILMTAFGDVDLAVKGIKAGAFDFILKPWQNAKLHASILSALKLKESRQEKERYRNVAATLEVTMTCPLRRSLVNQQGCKS